MRCETCRRPNPDGSRFCNGCGAALPAACAACGHANPNAAAFCNACGAALASDAGQGAASEPRSYTPRHLAERILSSRGALEGERKHVTVLFCDLADSTPLAAQLGAEAMHSVMDRCFQVILDAVHRFEGTVNQFLGDGAMALFGAPVALEDAPRRAVAAALAIQRELAPLAEEVRTRHGQPFQLRIGIHSGPVVVGSIGDDLRMDYTAVGDTTHLAARLQALAPPGGVLISEATEQLVRGFYELRDRGRLEAKGVAEPVRAFDVTGEAGARGRVEARAAQGLTPLCGRERELEMLREGFAAARAGRGRAVFLVGEAGIGKSRLLFELRRELEATPHTWVEGRCASYGRDSGFHAIADGLRREIGIEELDDDARALERLEQAEADQGGELAWSLPYLRGLLGLPTGDPEVDALDAATRRSETFRALRARMLRYAQRQPFVLVLEDLHWIDKASEEFLGYLLESIPALPVLVLLTHRPGYSHPFGDRSYHQRIALEPLSSDDTERVARAVLASDRLPEGLHDLITRKAEGNPFFIEEVVQSLLEDGSLTQDGRGVHLARELSELRVPDSIQDVLMARIDRLDDAPKRALQIASVIGREFAMRLLERIHEAGDEVRPVVEELRALELVYEKVAHPELAFMFKHALTHDVAYESVLESRRRALHHIVGSAIEELYRDRLPEHFEALAHHFGEAGDAEKAFRYHELASEKAAAAFANQAAAEHCRRALALAGELGEQVPRPLRRRLERRLGAVCGAISDSLTSAAAFRRAAELADTPEGRAFDLARAAHSGFWGHLYEEVTSDIDAALEAGREAGPAGDDAVAYAMLIRSFQAAAFGDLDRAQRLGTQALARRPKSPEVCALASYLHGQGAEWAGRYAEALELQEGAVRYAREAGTPVYVIGGLWFAGKALACLGRYAESLERMRSALDASERIGDRGWRARILNTLGWIHAELGDAEGAAPFNLRSTEIGHEMMQLGLVAGTPELIANAHVNLATDRIAVGDAEGAAEALEPVRTELGVDGDPWMRWRYTLHLRDAEGRLALLCGDPQQAVACAEAEAQGARAHGARKLEARALELRARALVRLERREEAERARATAAAIAHQIGYAPVCWRTEALGAELLQRGGDASRAESLRARTREAALKSAGLPGDAGLRRALAAHLEQLLADPLRP